MKILKEKPAELVELEVDLTEVERKDLIEYADNNIPKNVLQNYLIEWAITNILEHSLADEMLSKLPKEKKNGNKRSPRKTSTK